MINEDSFILSLIDNGFSEEEAEMIAQDWIDQEDD